MILRNKVDRKIQVQLASSFYEVEPGQTITVSEEIGDRMQLAYSHVLEIVTEEKIPPVLVNLSEIHEVEVPKPILHVSQMQTPVLEIKNKKLTPKKK